MTRQLHAGRRCGLLDLAPGPVGELLGCVGRPIENHTDLVERDGEGVVEHEGQPLGRSECLEHDEERRSD